MTSSKYDPEIDPAPLAGILGVDFVPDLLRLAVTHSSWGYEHGGHGDNERLEFLGDSVLGLAVAAKLYRDHADLDEGELSRRHHALVSTVSLAEIGREIGLGRYLRLGRSEQLSHGREKDSLLADAVEALIGAAYLSVGAVEADALVLRLIGDRFQYAERLGARLDPKTSLLEIIEALGADAPVYTVTGAGPDHDRVYTSICRVDRTGELLAETSGTGRSKKQAELASALAAWHELSRTPLGAGPAA